MTRRLWGGSLPPNYEYFWNRTFGRGTCAFLSAIVVTSVSLPSIQRPAESQVDAVFEAPKGKNGNATWGLRHGPEGFNNATWGNRSWGKDAFKSGDSGAPHSKFDSFLSRRLANPGEDSVDVIASMDGPSSSARERSIEAVGARINTRLPGINALAVSVPVNRLNVIAKLGWITHISEDVQSRKFDEFTVQSSLADAAFSDYGVTGRDVAVAVLDSGVKRRPDLNVKGTYTSRVIADVSFVPNDTSVLDPCGHGSHVAGVIAGNGKSSTGTVFTKTFYGIAREANIVNVRVLDANGAGKVSTIIQGIDWVIANRGRFNIRVLNISLGHPVGESYRTDPLCLAVERAWKAGITVVVAAGNSGRVNSTAAPGMDNEGYGAAYGSIESPGNSPYCITVGATKDAAGDRASDRIATYSSRGPTRLDFVLKPDLVAPGNRVISLRCPGSTVDVEYGSTNTIPLSFYTVLGTQLETWEYFRLSGTSIAAPVVAGAAALMLQRDPSLTPDSIKARLMMSADKWLDTDGRYDICTYGAGYINIRQALDASATATGYAVSPTLSRSADGYVYIDQSSTTWGANVIWGLDGVDKLNVIWGEYIAPATDNIIWGSSTLWGLAVWGDNIIWGSTTDADIRANSVYGEN